MAKTLGLSVKKYVFKPYSKIFPELFQKERERILSNIDQRLVIEHTGSTAVPGLGGKGIIDIAIAVNKEDMDLVSQQLQAIGYEFRPTFSTQNRLYFITYLADPEEESRRYHIHLTYPENSEWIEFLRFRDYLRSHPKEVQEYAELKKQAVFEADDNGEKYRKLKEPMFKKVNSKASDAAIRGMKKENENEKLDSIFEKCKIFYKESISVEEEDALIEGITEEALLKKELSPIKSFAFIIKDSNLKILGGVKGSSYYGCLYIDSLWIMPALRKQGWGSRLMEKAEELAKNRNCSFISLTTMDWEALPFYQKLGFEIEFIREGFENNSKMYLLRKNL